METEFRLQIQKCNLKNARKAALIDKIGRVVIGKG